MSIALRPYEGRDHDAVIDLWRACDLLRPWNDPDEDIARKRDHDPRGLVVAAEDELIVGTLMFGYEGHRGWLNYLGVLPSHRGRGVGSLLVRHAERELVSWGCPKVNLQVRATNLAVVEYYRRLGYERDEAVSMGRRLGPETEGTTGRPDN